MSAKRVCVAAITRGRPIMLGSLLRSWSSCTLPKDVDVSFLVVENGSATSKHVVEQSGLQVHYAVEPQIGIPFARNTAIQIALSRGADLVAFVDDDEVVSQDWLTQLLGEYERSDAVFVGGPVHAIGPDDQITRWQRLILGGIRRRSEIKARKAAARKRLGQMNRVTIVTSNWLAHRSLFVEHGLQFDEEYAISGGSDADFDRQVGRLKLRKSWAEDAIVYEVNPPQRLSLTYQFCRARDQSIVSFRRKFREAGWRAVITAVPPLVFRTAFLIVALPISPALGGWGIVAIARSAGWTLGRCIALVGGTSKLYLRVTGH